MPVVDLKHIFYQLCTAMLVELEQNNSLTSFVCGTNMAAKPLSSESQGIGCKSSNGNLAS